MQTTILFRRTVAVFLLLLGVFLLTNSIVPSPADAAVVRSGETVSIAQEQIVPGDLYVMGNNVIVSGTVEGDIYVMGGTLTVNGAVKGDVLALGGTIAIHGPVSDDLRAVGGKVIVADTIGGDVAVFGGELSTLSTAKIAGEILFYGGKVTVGGEVKGVVHTRGDALVVEGSVGGIDAVLAGALTLENSANVKGDVSYGSSAELRRAQGATISGEVMRQETNVRSDVGGFLPFAFMLAFSSLVAVLLFRERLRPIVIGAERHVGMTLLVGFIALVLPPLAIALLMVSVLGALVGAGMLFGYLLFILASIILAPVVTGALIAHRVTGGHPISWVYTLGGVLVVLLVLWIPYLGSILMFGLLIFTLGLMGRSIYRTLTGKTL